MLLGFNLDFYYAVLCASVGKVRGFRESGRTVSANFGMGGWRMMIG